MTGLGRRLAAQDIPSLRFDDRGLVPVIAQDRTTGSVLMLAWADVDALRTSLESGRMTYWSRSRQESWQKGQTSGHFQDVVSLHADCDGDAVLAIVEQHGPACHTGTGSCWSADDAKPLAGVLGELDRLIAQRKQDPQDGYTDRLLAEPALAAAKVEEEAAELARVVRGEDNEDPLEHEAADLFYHALAAAHARGAGLAGILAELHRRRSA